MIIKALRPPSIVIVTFDLNFAKSDDYKCVTEALEEIGLLKTITDENGTTATLPENIYCGEFPNKETDVTSLREGIRQAVVKALEACHVKAEYVIFVAGVPWAWVTSKVR